MFHLYCVYLLHWFWIFGRANQLYNCLTLHFYCFWIFGRATQPYNRMALHLYCFWIFVAAIQLFCSTLLQISLKQCSAAVLHLRAPGVAVSVQCIVKLCNALWEYRVYSGSTVQCIVRKGSASAQSDIHCCSAVHCTESQCREWEGCAVQWSSASAQSGRVFARKEQWELDSLLSPCHFYTPSRLILATQFIINITIRHDICHIFYTSNFNI